MPSGHNPADYVTRRIFADGAGWRDGCRSPCSIARTTPIDGTAPALLYGYGAYGMSLPAAFSVSALSLADRGFVYATAHVRGGMEKGYRWYRLGRREHKANTFSDFIAAAEMLIAEGYAAPGRIVAEGGSAGGLLMGAVANMRPELWAGVLAEVPFVDVLNTMSDDTPAADAAGMARMGQSARVGGGFRAGSPAMRPTSRSRRRTIRRSSRWPG